MGWRYCDMTRSRSARPARPVDPDDVSRVWAEHNTAVGNAHLDPERDSARWSAGTHRSVSPLDGVTITGMMRIETGSAALCERPPPSDLMTFG